MENSWYSFDVSPSWVLVIFLVSLGLSVLLYTKKGMPWSKTPNVLMGFLRFSSIFLILLLILNPLLQLNQNEVEKPSIVFAIDNSASITMRSSSEEIRQLKDWLEHSKEKLGDNYDLETFLLSGSGDSVTFDSKTTNLSELLSRIENIYEGRNLGAVVLVSDGIINQGQSPAYRNYSFPVYTLGLGDTIPPKDISISDIRSNRVAYQGNKFPIEVAVSQKGFDNRSIKVSLREGNKVLKEQNLTLDKTTQNITFFPDATEPGLKRLTITITTIEGESSTLNNRQDVFVDVIEGKEKILILAPAPHPDINAIRSVLADASNYETSLYIPGISKEKPTANNFDVIIEHQAFSRSNFKEYDSNGKWYILGSTFNYAQLNQDLSFISIQQTGNQRDQVRPAYNESFSKFVLSDRLTDRLSNYPPLTVPFGSYKMTGPTETLLFQQVGNIPTERPMLAFFDDGSKKQAVLIGAGIWQWKLQEAGSEGNAELFRELVLKTIQFLSIKANKDRFIAKPRKNEYLVSDRIFLDTEVYNDIYERAYGNKIRLTITNENRKSESFEMVDSPTNNSFNLGTRPAGIYTFNASVDIGGKTYTEKGSFLVRDIQLESVELTANHNLLRTISLNSEGDFYTLRQSDALTNGLEGLGLKNVIRTSEQYIPLINSMWIILLIGLLLGTEWFLRKYLGAY